MEMDTVEVKVVGVYEEHITGPNFPLDKTFVTLRDEKGREFRIWIARDMAVAISMALDKETPDRPFTHDLMKNLMESADIHLEQVVIHDIQDDTFYARLTLNQQQRVFQLDARPSDSIAMALRAGTPILVAEKVMEHISQTQAR